MMTNPNAHLGIELIPDEQPPRVFTGIEINRHIVIDVLHKTYWWYYNQKVVTWKASGFYQCYKCNLLGKADAFSEYRCFKV